MTPTHTLSREHIDCHGKAWPQGTPVRAVGHLHGLRIVRAVSAEGVPVSLAVRTDMLEERILAPTFVRPDRLDAPECPCGCGQPYVGDKEIARLRARARWGADTRKMPYFERVAVVSARGFLQKHDVLGGGPRLVDPEEALKGTPVPPPPAAQFPPGTPRWVLEAQARDDEDGAWEELASFEVALPEVYLILACLAVGAALWAACYFL